jgi:hypothetical protein
MQTVTTIDETKRKSGKENQDEDEDDDKSNIKENRDESVDVDKRSNEIDEEQIHLRPNCYRLMTAWYYNHVQT